MRLLCAITVGANFCWQARRQTALQETNLNDMDDPICPLCLRSIPANVAQSKHHLIPKLKGGKTGETVLLHHICHKEIHASLTEAELARDYHSIDAVRQHPRIAKFINWIKKTASRFQFARSKQKPVRFAEKARNRALPNPHRVMMIDC